MDNQTFFNRTVAHLVLQKRPSIRKEVDGITTTCLYRGPNDTKCAIGYWIPDADYNPKMEKNVVSTLINCYKLNKIVGFDVPSALAGRLQSLHDNHYDNWNNMGFNLAARQESNYIAATYGLMPLFLMIFGVE